MPTALATSAPIRRLRHLGHAAGWRLAFLFGRNPFTLRERLAYVDPRIRPSLAELVHRSRRRYGDDVVYRLGGWRIGTLPDTDVDAERYLEATEIVLRETFLYRHHEHPHARPRPGDIALDLGGHIGVTMLQFARAVGPRGEVHSFEPMTPEVVERNRRGNRLRNAEVVAAGVADRSGTAVLSTTDESIDSSIVREQQGTADPERSRTIAITTIDDYVASRPLPRVDFIKMDIEGAEELALRGARRTIERFRPRWQISSYHIDHVGERQHPKLVRILREHGYRIEEVDGMRIYAW